MIRKILMAIITFPIKILKGVRDWFLHTFKNLHLSMRKRIATEYLIVYSLTGLFTILLVPFVFVFFEIDESSDDVNNKLNQYFVSYIEEIYDVEALEVKINQVYIIEDVSLSVIIEENGEITTANTGEFLKNMFPNNPWEYITNIFNRGLIAKKISKYTLYNEKTNREIIFEIKGYYSIVKYKLEIVTLGSILLVFYSVGFVFISMIGGARVKKVLSPIFHMTKIAEQISVSNLNMRLDIESTKYELKDLAITLNDMLNRLDKDYGKQKSFVSDVSHELRTPISIISGYASMLERWGKKDEEILNESIEAIKGEAGNMQQLVENLLTLVRSDNQTLKYEPTDFDIGKQICSIVKEFNMVNTKDQYITCESKEGICVHLDEAKIKQTLRIFIDNAIKYTPENGGIKIKCYDIDKEVYIHIKDTGIGIYKEDLPYLFERFYRSDESRTRQTGGHGLGLAIAKVMIIGHKGKIKVKSRIGKGSEFIITLPKILDDNI